MYVVHLPVPVLFALNRDIYTRFDIETIRGRSGTRMTKRQEPRQDFASRTIGVRIRATVILEPYY
jgi:hypothetical protein